jgi:hypothetical protein
MYLSSCDAIKITGLYSVGMRICLYVISKDEKHGINSNFISLGCLKAAGAMFSFSLIYFFSLHIHIHYVHTSIDANQQFNKMYCNVRVQVRFKQKSVQKSVLRLKRFSSSL